MKMKNKLFIILFFIFCYKLSVAQQEEFPLGSPYTIFGIGDIQYTSSLKTDAMNIQGISLYGDYVNNLNPAANSKLSYTMISASFKYSFLKSSDNIKSSTSSYGNVYGMNVGIPFNHDNGWVLNLGFNPLSQINYNIQNDVTLNGVNVSQIYAGNGGISRVNMGMTYKLFHNISIGGEYDYAFGNIKRLSYLQFNDPIYQNSFTRTENNLSGSYFKGGLIFDIGKILNLKSIENLTLGAIYQSSLTLESSEDVIYGTSLGQDSATLARDNLRIPQAFGFGITNQFGSRFIASGDFFYQQWSQFTEGSAVVNDMKNSYRVGLGFIILPPEKRDKSFLEGIEYRFGFEYDNSYFLINNEQINRFGIGLGFGIPINKYNSIDIGINYYLRGKTDNGFIKDNLIKITAGINIGELWFLKPKED